MKIFWTSGINFERLYFQNYQKHLQKFSVDLEVFYISGPKGKFSSPVMTYLSICRCVDYGGDETVAVFHFGTSNKKKQRVFWDAR